MTRILWADDQVDVIDTLSSLLSPLDPKITQAKSGDEALGKLKRGHFDLIILDLMMPPDKWGGLWLLEEMSKANIRVPTLVLSGEGAQSETIAALRLGAKDYVTKDIVELDLLDRVRAILVDSHRDRDSHVASSFPTPIALPYKRYITTTPPVSKLRRLIEVYESSLRLCSIVGICELWALKDMQASSEPWGLGLLRGPSMGTWDRARHAIARQLERGASFFQIHDAFDNRVINAIIRVRNDISHGAEPSEARAHQLLDEWQGPLQMFVDSLRGCLSLEILLPISLSYDGAQFEVEGRRITGDSITLPSAVSKIATPPICKQPYLISSKPEETPWVSLFPLLHLEPAVEPNAWRILVFDGLRMSRDVKTPSGEEPIRYIDIWSGKRNVEIADHPMSSMLPRFLFRSLASRGRNTH